MRFGHAEILVSSSAFVASIAAAGTEEWKEVAHKVMVEVENVTAVKRVLIGYPIVEPGSHLVGMDFGRIEGTLEVVHQAGSI